MVGLVGRVVPLAAVALLATEALGAPPPAPRLVVAISVDQLSADLFAQHRSSFRGGLARLAREGVVFPQGYQSHAATETCPGHSTILSGRHPSGTGIISNSWYAGKEAAADPYVLEKRYCAFDPAFTVPGRPEGPRGPGSLRVSTLGEWMRRAEPRSRTVAVAGKDRAAIMMAGHDPTAVFWWDEELGFNTYVPPGGDASERLGPVAAFNAALAARWSRERPAWRVAEARCRALEGPERYGGMVLDHVLPPPLELAPGTAPDALGPPLRRDERFQRWLRASPVLDELTLQLAVELVHRYALGQRGVPDLLAVSLSATDYVGHTYGNEGPEMCDQLAHLDETLGVFLATLDRLQVPYAVVLTADHGAVDAAERVAERGVEAARVPDDLAAEANRALRADPALRLDFDPLVREADGFFIDRLGPDDPRRKAVALAARRFLERRPEVAAVFSRDEVLATQVPPHQAPDELTLLERFAESVDKERSGDLLVALRPYASVGLPHRRGDYVAGHGSPWNYDRRVPIVFWRSGGRAFEQPLPVETVDIAPTLAALLGLPVPRAVPLDGVCRDLDPGPASTCGQ